uniref:Protein kinase domain-containing protein n=1 Tax=Parascaris equorum TaxID=6256 RepID=A0A914RHI1_PAREQ
MSSPVGLVSYTQDYFWTERGADMVHKGRHRETGEFVAVKTCEMHDDVAHQREIALLRSLDSPYIVKYLASQQVNECYLIPHFFHERLILSPSSTV